MHHPVSVLCSYGPSQYLAMQKKVSYTNQLPVQPYFMSMEKWDTRLLHPGGQPFTMWYLWAITTWHVNGHMVALAHGSHAKFPGRYTYLFTVDNALPLTEYVYPKGFCFCFVITATVIFSLFFM